MKKSTLLMTLALILSITLGIGGTMAYLQDTDEDVNVMTLGNVHIEQIEKERVEQTNSGKDELQDFTQGKPLYPAVGDEDWVESDNGRVYQEWPFVTPTAGSALFDADELKNVIDKFVFVENTGKSDAYVRTIFAFEVGSYDFEKVIEDQLIHLNSNNINSPEATSGHWAWKWIKTPVEIDGGNYVIAEAIYLHKGSVQGTEAEGILPAGETSYPSLLQVFLDPTATNEDMEALDGNGNGTYDILVVSQAVQTMGFTKAQEALDTAFGEITADNNPWVKNGEQIEGTPAFPVMIDSLAELDAALAEADEVVVELSGEQETNIEIPGGKDVTFIGNGKDTVLSGQIASTTSEAGTLTLKNLTINVDEKILDSTGISQTGKSGIAIWGNQTVICENVTFNMSLTDATAITAWWDTGVGTTIIVRNCTFNCNGQRPIRATGNVTVENCTFNDPYRYAVQLTAKASTATLLDKATINFKNNTIVNGPNGKTFVYGIQLEGADYGCNDCVIYGSGNTIVDGGADSTMYYCECGKVVHETIEWHTEVAPVHENDK